MSNSDRMGVRNGVTAVVIFMSLHLLQACAPMALAQSPLNSLANERCKELKVGSSYLACRNQADLQQGKYNREAAEIRARQAPLVLRMGSFKSE